MAVLIAHLKMAGVVAKLSTAAATPRPAQLGLSRLCSRQDAATLVGKSTHSPRVVALFYALNRKAPLSVAKWRAACDRGRTADFSAKLTPLGPIGVASHENGRVFGKIIYRC